MVEYIVKAHFACQLIIVCCVVHNAHTYMLTHTPLCNRAGVNFKAHVSERQLVSLLTAVPLGNVTFAPSSYNCNGSEYNTVSCLQTPTQTVQCSSLKAISLQCTSKQKCYSNTTWPQLEENSSPFKGCPVPYVYRCIWRGA